MPRAFREDSLVIETAGRGHRDGWQVTQVPFPEEDGDFSTLGVIDEFATRAEAVRFARQQRRIHGGCWYVRPRLA